MKKLTLILVLLVGVALTSCDEHEGVLAGKNDTNLQGLINKHQVVEIDRCQYIVYDTFKGYAAFGFMAHKGNCPNKIHCHNQ